MTDRLPLTRIRQLAEGNHGPDVKALSQRGAGISRAIRGAVRGARCLAGEIMTPYQDACARNRAYTWERLRYIFEPATPARVVALKRINPIEQFPGRAPHGGGRPLIPGSRSESQRKYREKCAKKPCSVDGCPRGQHSGGMCAAHNRRQRRGTLEGDQR